MPGSRTLGWSLAREILQYTLVGFAAASVVLISQNLLRRMDDLTAVGFTGGDLLVVLRCLFPMLTAYSIPVALLFGTVLALRRRVSDSEVLAMRACGLGVRTLLVPAMMTGAVVTGISAWLLIAVEHEARRELIRLFNTVAARGQILQAGDFRGIGQRVIYVAERHRDDSLEGVMISDESQDRPFLIFAERGRLALDEASSKLRLELGRGEIHIATDPGEDDLYERVLFRRFDYELDASELLAGDERPRRPKQMTLPELREVLARAQAGDPLADLRRQNPRLYEIEIQRRLALPMAPLLFAIAAVPLALAGRRGSRAWGPMACALLAFSFYAVLMLLQYLARESWIPASLAFWGPNAGLLVLSIAGVRRAERVLE